MRWQVHGTDAMTGQPLTLGIDEPEAVQAVHSALSKKILVTRITPSRPLPRTYFIGAIGLIALLGGLCAYLFSAEQAAERRLRENAYRQSELTRSLAQTEESLRNFSSHLSAAPVEKNAAPKQNDGLLDQLAAAQARIGQFELQIASEPQTPSADPTIATLRQQLSEAQRRAEDLQTQLDRLNTSSKVELGAALAANQKLASEMDALKTELLTAAAKSTIPAAPVNDVDAMAEPVATPQRWALPARFAEAADFLNMHFDKETVHYVPAGDGTVAGSGVWSANADTLNLLFDREKERVFSATLSVSLAADAPREKLTENLHLVGKFMGVFAPSVKSPEEWIQATVNDLAGKGPANRIQLLEGDFLITAWNEHGQNGVVDFRIESSASVLAQ